MATVKTDTIKRISEDDLLILGSNAYSDYLALENQAQGAQTPRVIDAFDDYCVFRIEAEERGMDPDVFEGPLKKVIYYNF